MAQFGSGPVFLGESMNTSSRHVRNVALGALTAALLCVAAKVQAQAIYKGIDENGRVTFSDRPPPKTTLVPRRNAGVEAGEAARRLKQAQLDRARAAGSPGPAN